MNPYFVWLSLYALAITPLSLRVNAQLSSSVNYRLTLFLSGVPIVMQSFRLKKEGEHYYLEKQGLPVGKPQKREIPQEMEPLRRVFAVLKEEKALRAAIRRALKIDRVFVEGTVAFENAMTTALCFGALRTLLQTLEACGARPERLTVRLRASFTQKPGAIKVTGILFVRLGSLLLVAAMAAALLAGGSQDRKSNKEARHAASN